MVVSMVGTCTSLQQNSGFVSACACTGKGLCPWLSMGSTEVDRGLSSSFSLARLSLARLNNSHTKIHERINSRNHKKKPGTERGRRAPALLQTESHAKSRTSSGGGQVHVPAAAALHALRNVDHLPRDQVAVYPLLRVVLRVPLDAVGAARDVGLNLLRALAVLHSVHGGQARVVLGRRGDEGCLACPAGRRGGGGLVVSG